MTFSTNAQADLLYWMTFVIALLFASLSAWRFWLSRASAKEFLRENSTGLLAAAVLTVAVMTLLSPSLRVQWDETDLLATSKQMHLQRSDRYAAEALPSEDGLQTVSWGIDKRPPLFPFLVSVIHDLTGFRIANAFVLNSLLFFTLLFLVFHHLLPYGRTRALLALLLLLSNPTLLRVASSAGFDLMACVFLLALIVSAERFISKPGTERFLCLGMTGAAFSSVRYESVLLFLAVLAVSVYQSRRQWRPGRAHFLSLTVLAALLAPEVLLSLRIHGPEAYPEAGREPLFSFRHGLEHLPSFIKGFFHVGPDAPFSGLANWIGLPIAIRMLCTRKITRIELLVLGSVLFSLVVSLFHFYGDVGYPSAPRLFLPVSIAGSLCVLYFPARFARLQEKPRLKTAALLATLIVLIGLDARAIHAVERADRSPTAKTAAVLETEAIDQLLPMMEPLRGRSLVVSNVSLYFVMRGFASIRPSTFAKNTETLSGFRIKGEPIQVFFFDGPGTDWDIRGSSMPLNGAHDTISIAEAIHGLKTETVAHRGGRSPVRLLRWVRE